VSVCAVDVLKTTVGGIDLGVLEHVEIAGILTPDAQRTPAQLRIDVSVLLLAAEELIEGPQLVLNEEFYESLPWVSNPLYTQ